MTMPPPVPRTGFVTVLGRMSLLISAVGLLGALALAAGAVALGDGTVARIAAEPLLPPSVAWMLEQRRALALCGLLLSLLFVAASWGVLRRQEWARWAFIAFLVLTAALNFAMLPVVSQLFDGVRAAMPAALLDTREGQDLLAQLRISRAVSLGLSVATALAFAGLHGWLAWKLCTAPVRAEFRR